MHHLHQYLTLGLTALGIASAPAQSITLPMDTAALFHENAVPLSGGASARAAGGSPLGLARTLAADIKRIQPGELAIGGVALGQSESSVTRRLGPPQRREDTGESVKLVYPGLEVHVGAGANGVVELTSTGARHCTASHVCPGMPLGAATRAYGAVRPTQRETGEFLEYVPEGSTCWLQLSAPNSIIRSIRVACQP